MDLLLWWLCCGCGCGGLLLLLLLLLLRKKPSESESRVRPHPLSIKARKKGFFLETKQKAYGESSREEEILRERESKRERERKSLWGMKEVCEVFYRCNGLAYKKGLERRPNGLELGFFIYFFI